MKNYSFLLFCLFIIVLSCEENTDNSDTSESDVPPLTITVYNALDWSPVNPDLPECIGATVELTGASGTVSGLTNDEGKIVFRDLEIGSYTILVTMGDLSNLIDKDNTTGKGYIAIGIFQTMQEIDAYVNSEGESIQPFAVPGDLILSDINNDGKINDNDKVLSESVDFVPYVDVNADGIINGDDRIDGSYQYSAGEDEIIYIGM